MEKVKDQSKVGSLIVCKRSIWKFYEWAVVIAPLILMLSHWYIFYVFSQNNYELLKYSSVNEICIAWIYSILYLYVPLMILPASYFFKWNNFFRIPFVYFIFINIERIYYSAWFCTNEMVDTHYFLIYCIICMYGIEILGMIFKYKKAFPKYYDTLILYIVRKVRKVFYGDLQNKERYNKIMNVMEERG